jgi:hypothetical protein
MTTSSGAPVRTMVADAEGRRSPSPCSIHARARYVLSSRTVRRWAGTEALQEIRMNMSLSIGPVVALIAGILILIMPRLLNYIIALYLIIIGVLGLLGDTRGARVGANAAETPPAAVQYANPAPTGPSIGI